ncbi:MAG: N-acetyltransferase [Terriglobales bacterium]
MGFGKGKIRTRKALLPDAPAIHALIAHYANQDVLLPRTIGEICENARDFTVVEQNGRVIGCGALHLYGQHLAEVRSIAVAREAQGQGAGSKLVDALLKEARQHQVAQVCLFTRSPEYFGRLGFVEVPHAVLPDKIFKDCRNCPMFTRCDEIAMVYAGSTAHTAVSEPACEVDAVLRPERQPAIASLVQIGRADS